jgi:hypothetical protein
MVDKAEINVPVNIRQAGDTTNIQVVQAHEGGLGYLDVEAEVKNLYPVIAPLGGQPRPIRPPS